MENIIDWQNDDYLNLKIPEFLTFDSPRVSPVAEQANLAAEESGPAANGLNQVMNQRYRSFDLAVGTEASNMIRITPNASTLTFNGRSSNVRILELDVFVQVSATLLLRVKPRKRHRQRQCRNGSRARSSAEPLCKKGLMLGDKTDGNEALAVFRGLYSALQRSPGRHSV